MFLVDTSPPMGTLKTVELPGLNGETISKAMSHLEYVLRFAKLKIQEMVYYLIHEMARHINHVTTFSDLQRPQDRSVWCHYIRL